MNLKRELKSCIAVIHRVILNWKRSMIHYAGNEKMNYKTKPRVKKVNFCEWERLETDEAFKEGFLLAMNNISLKINSISKNWSCNNE